MKLGGKGYEIFTVQKHITNRISKLSVPIDIVTKSEGDRPQCPSHRQYLFAIVYCFLWVNNLFSHTYKPHLFLHITSSYFNQHLLRF